MLGITEGNGFKLGIKYDVYPYETSTEAYHRFLRICKEKESPKILAVPDCDSWPMIEREWKLPNWPEIDVLSASVEAWAFSGNIINNILEAIGGEVIDFSLNCMQDLNSVKRLEFSKDEFLNFLDVY